MRLQKSRFVTMAAALTLSAGLGLFVLPASAQPTAGAAASVRIAIANPAHIFADMAETKALQAEMAEQQKQFQIAQKSKTDEITDMKNKRDALNPEHPQWAQLNADLAKMTAEYRVWIETEKAKAESMQKVKMKKLFHEIEEAVGQIAKQDGYDLVLADTRDPLPSSLDEIDVRTLRGMLLSRDVIYATDRIDISQAVVTLLDAKYRGGVANK